MLLKDPEVLPTLQIPWCCDQQLIWTFQELPMQLQQLLLGLLPVDACCWCLECFLTVNWRGLCQLWERGPPPASASSTCVGTSSWRWRSGWQTSGGRSWSDCPVRSQCPVPKKNDNFTNLDGAYFCWILLKVFWGFWLVITPHYFKDFGRLCVYFQLEFFSLIYHYCDRRYFWNYDNVIEYSALLLMHTLFQFFHPPYCIEKVQWDQKWSKSFRIRAFFVLYKIWQKRVDWGFGFPTFMGYHPTYVENRIKVFE